MTNLAHPAPCADPSLDAGELLAGEARGLMSTGQALCAPAVLGVINQRLGGDLSPELVPRLTAAFPQGMHNSGSICGALSGGMMALGLFLDPGRALEKATRALHRQFEAAHGSTNCLTLTRQAGGRQARHQLCVELTGLATALATRLILEQRPELAASMNLPQAASPARPQWWRRLRLA